MTPQEQAAKRLLKAIDRAIWESKKYKAKEITKNILITIWTVTVFPLILIWMFITDK